MGCDSEVDLCLPRTEVVQEIVQGWLGDKGQANAVSITAKACSWESLLMHQTVILITFIFK